MRESPVVVWGLLEDGPVAAVLRWLGHLGVPTVFIDQRKVLEYTAELDVQAHAIGRILGPDCDIEIGSARSLYPRPYNLSHLDTFDNADRSSEVWRRAVEFEERMLLWCELAREKVVNRPSAMASNTSKPYQLEIIAEHGFAVPATVITSDPDVAVAFHRQYGEVIYKSISGWRSRVSRLTSDDLTRIDDVICCPTQFQEYVRGTDYRVHVLEDTVFAHRILSSGDDYRYAAGTAIERADLPADVEKLCLTVTRALGLVFGGVDLRRSEDNKWYCFEVNPSPGFTYFEDASEPVARRLAEVLRAQS